ASACAALAPRMIGPAGMSGRIADVDVVTARPDTMLVGAATGGVWLSEDGGVTWRPIFDDQPLQGIGAVAFFQPDPRLIWVGTGEGNPRNSAGVGRGVYRSDDFGETWRFLGLEHSERIHRVIPHPADPDVAYVGAMGPAWGDGEQRGVYRTTDGGETWERVLYANERTGVADLVMDPSDPDKLFAAMWEFRRWPWFFDSGGPGSGLYVTTDGGDTWDELTAEDGLPEGELGRIGVAFHHANPDIVTALVEAETSALIRSDDGGATWRTLSDDEGVASRPFYYADIRVDPRDPDRILNLQGSLRVSEDAGESWRTLVPSGKVHGDIHDVYVHPTRELLLNANDGGLGISRNGGETWRWVENLPIAQFYHIDVDDDIPFNVYGGMQDNGSWLGPAEVWTDDAIRNAHWTRVGGGDGFRVLDDPTTGDVGFAMSQGGNLYRFDRFTGERLDIQPIAPEPDGELRFNWNAALAGDPHDPRTIYLGSQYVHRSTDGGLTWSIISPDLTTDDPAKQRQDESGGLSPENTGAENHTTILVIAPSPVDEDVIWAGTDDGNVQLTRDDGASWTNVVGPVPGVPDASWVSDIEASPYDAGTAFVTFDEHRRGDRTTYVYRTTDYGRSWTSIATPEIDGFAHVIEQDPVEPRILYLGTEFGLWFTLDGGASWAHWRDGLPAVPVRGLAVHQREPALVIGTHGRAAYVVDDVTPLRELAADRALLARPVHLFRPPHAWQHAERESPPGYRSTGDAMFAGENRPHGALITYAVADTGDAFVEVVDGDGAIVRTIEDEADAGVNRVIWDLRTEDVEVDGAGTVRGHEVIAGDYAVRVTAAGATSVALPLEVRPDPRAVIPDAARIARAEMLRRAVDAARAPLEL
ncbi:MAG: VPS10 domain-containing protein, partial [Longimicrobiales bacterium]